ncbi:PREDICTED: ATP-dependent RNA helicase DHX36-like [Nicrophorus vespilloides]|uniref:RNA helicase n=1 Tax=Nicrophorus vespilloides TaxID=110193 RepID=A0ABM1NJB0_NICVS|nr:PREDICTED: ATP-dependent RNA helicase DHX36-like [Nicrophorus vespilloides]
MSGQAGFFAERNKRGKKFGNHNKNLRKRSSSPSPSAETMDNSKHPKHLKGREIGMYYAFLSKQKNKKVSIKPIGNVLLPESKQKEIQKLLEATKDAPFNKHNVNSKFETNFMKVLHGNINDKLSEVKTFESNKNADQLLQIEYSKKQTDPKYRHMQQQRQRLPAYKMRSEILKAVAENQVVIISGETGCGKTTQVSQFILDSHMEAGTGSQCCIICSQPRRISAISVAERVAEERAEDLGQSVGYQIRLENVLPRNRGSITFCTTGVILKKMETNLSLSGISHLILDEIHERDVQSDFLITLLKEVIKKRKDLKVILMSATLNAKAFGDYFKVATLTEIPGFTYEVTEYYLEDVIHMTNFEFPPDNRRFLKNKNADFEALIEPYVRKLMRDKEYPRRVCNELMKKGSEELNLDLIMELIIMICNKEKDPGAILVFLTGYSEISQLNTMMSKSGKFSKHRYLIIPLHSQMPSVEQKFIFRPPPPGVRKIILSTNIAETSITIDDVVFVIDCGKIKISNFKVETNQQTLMPEWVSIANANQRRGRAGRVKPGICYHLFSRGRQQYMEAYQKPEILRKRLEDVILMLKLLQLGKADAFLESLMNPPDSEAVSVSLDLLKRMNALDESENLTPLGFHLARLPVSPQIGKMILLGSIFSCLNPILSVAASLDFKDAFMMPLGCERNVDQVKVKLANGNMSDHMIFHEAMTIFERTNNKKQFCWDHYLSHTTMNLLENMKKQFAEYLFDLNFVPNSNPKCSECNENSGNISLVKAVICAGLYPNVIVNNHKFSKHGVINRFQTLDRKKVKLHPKSVLNQVEIFESPLIVYYLKMKSSNDFIHDGTVVHPLSLLFFGDRFAEHNERNDKHSISVNEGLRFWCSEGTGNIIAALRDRMNLFLKWKVAHPGYVNWSSDEDGEIKTLRAIMELITSEECGRNEHDPDESLDEDND